MDKGFYEISAVTPPPPVEIAGTDNAHIAWRLVSDMMHSLCVFTEDDNKTRSDKINASLQMAKNIGPQDALEAQLIAQLVSSHNVASDALHRANQKGQSAEVQAMALKQAAQFMRLFRDQTRTLIAYRGTPKQIKLDRRLDKVTEKARQREALHNDLRTLQEMEKNVRKGEPAIPETNDAPSQPADVQSQI